MEVPLWDRRLFGYETWKNVYFVSDDIYKRVIDEPFVQNLAPEQIYTLEYFKGKTFHLMTNFHFISVSDKHEIINSIRFQTDVNFRVGMAQTMLWWPRPKIGFYMVEPFVKWNEDSFPFVISWIFSNYPPRSFAPIVPDFNKIGELFDIDLNEKIDSYWSRLDETFDETRFEIIKWSLKKELVRLRTIDFYKNLDLIIVK